MRHRVLCAAAVVLAAWSITIAQNARLNAMGGVDIVKDPSNILRIGAFMNDYPDLVQASAAGALPAGFRYSLGIKSLGDVLRLGFLSTPGPVMSSNFYEDAIVRLNDIDEAPDISDFFPVPHLLLGMDLGGLKLGFDVFCEIAYSRYREEVNNPPSEVEASKMALHPGAVASAIIGGDEFYLAPFVGAGLPLIAGEYDDGIPGNLLEVSSEKGYFLTGGAELGINAGISWILGAAYSMELYQFAIDEGDPIVETEYDEFPGHFLRAYGGFTTTVLEDLLLGAEYSLRMGNIGQITETAAGTITVRDIGLTHSLGAGVEKPIEGFWIFDQLTPRAGLQAFMFDPITLTEVETAVDETSTAVYDQSLRTSVNPTVGVGVGKGRFRLDVNVSLGSWAGLIAGPAVLEGTLTLDFGGGSGSTSRAGGPSPSFGGASDASETPTYQSPSSTSSSDSDTTSSSLFDAGSGL